MPRTKAPAKPNPVEIQQVRLAELVAGENDRVHFDEDALAELAASIQQHGLAQPITVRPIYQDGEPLGIYQIVAGERRTRACRLLGWETVPAIVKEMSDEQASAVMLAENLQRADLRPMEAARALDKRMRQWGWTVAQVAEQSHIRVDLAKRRLKLLLLTEAAQKLVDTGNLPLAHAEVMADLDVNRQAMAIRLFSGPRPLSLNDFRAYCSKLQEEQCQEALWSLTEFALEQIAEQEPVVLQNRGAGLKTIGRVPNFRPTNGFARTLERYIADLDAAGCKDEALVMCTLYDAMVRCGWTKVPAERLVPAHLLACEGA